MNDWADKTINRHWRKLRQAERDHRSGRKRARQRGNRRRFWTRFRRRTDWVFFVVKLIAVLTVLFQGWQNVDWLELFNTL